MNIRHLTPDNYLRQPWKNGGGVTTELLKEVVDDEVLWRLSIAAVTQSGQFSDFSGFDRSIMLLNGNGMVLSFDGAERGPTEQRIDQLFVPFAFAGECKTDCRLIDGPVEDFNLMVDRRRCRGRLHVQAFADTVTAHAVACDTIVLHCLRGAVDVVIGEARAALQTAGTLRFDRLDTMFADSSIALHAREFPCSLAIVEIDRF